MSRKNGGKAKKNGGLERPEREPIPSGNRVADALEELSWGLMAISGSADGLSHENISWPGAPYISILMKREADRLLDALDTVKKAVNGGAK